MKSTGPLAPDFAKFLTQMPENQRVGVVLAIPFPGDRRNRSTGDTIISKRGAKVFVKTSKTTNAKTSAGQTRTAYER